MADQHISWQDVMATAPGTLFTREQFEALLATVTINRTNWENLWQPSKVSRKKQHIARVKANG